MPSSWRIFDDIYQKRSYARKLKVGFSNGPANETHATFRDLGFVGREDGNFDVYSAGGLVTMRDLD